jgi:hypothetical protein
MESGIGQGIGEFHMAVVFPAHTALSSSTNLWITTPAAILTIALALGALALIGRIATTISMKDKAANAHMTSTAPAHRFRQPDPELTTGRGDVR